MTDGLSSCLSMKSFVILWLGKVAEDKSVVPLKNRPRLTLNMHFHELHDPKKLARDVTNRGRWGNGDAEVDFSKSEDMAYVMGLVRQAFEKQMGDTEVDG